MVIHSKLGNPRGRMRMGMRILPKMTKRQNSKRYRIIIIIIIIEII